MTATDISPTVLAECKYRGQKSFISMETAKYRLHVDLQSQLCKHGGAAPWCKIQSGIAPGIKFSGMTRLQVLATLPHVVVEKTEHGVVVRYNNDRN